MFERKTYGILAAALLRGSAFTNPASARAPSAAPKPGYNMLVKEGFVRCETCLLHIAFLIRLPTKGDVAECDYIVLKLVASFL